jgi:uncharacterized protein
MNKNKPNWQIFEEMIQEICYENDDVRLVDLIRNKTLDNIRISQALVIASRLGSLPIVQILIVSGADINYDYGALGGTPMTEAVCEGHIDIIKALLIAGANTSIPEYGEISHPLAIAARQGNIEIVRIIVESGANVNQIHQENLESAISAAAGAGCEEVFSYLSSLSNQKLRDEAAEILPYGIWERKIKEAADPQVIKLTSAVLNNDLEKVLKIIAEGVDVNGLDDVGCTALSLASSNDNYLIMEALLHVGADPNFVLKSEFESLNDGTTNLMRVSSKKTCLLLLNYGADMNMKDSQGETALMIAIKTSNVGIAEALLQQGADIDLSNKQNKTALDIANSNNDKIMLSLLKSIDV